LTDGYKREWSAIGWNNSLFYYCTQSENIKHFVWLVMFECIQNHLLVCGQYQQTYYNFLFLPPSFGSPTTLTMCPLNIHPPIYLTNHPSIKFASFLTTYVSACLFVLLPSLLSPNHQPTYLTTSQSVLSPAHRTIHTHISNIHTSTYLLTNLPNICPFVRPLT
jgi:hypothetical protein